MTALRSHHKIPVYRPADDGIEPWLNLTKAAAHLGVSPKTLRLAAESGEIEALHPLTSHTSGRTTSKGEDHRICCGLRHLPRICY